MYDVDLLLKVSHFGEHHLDLTFLTLFFEFGDVLLQGFDLSLQFGLHTLEGKEVSPFPFILFGVVVSLLLHFLGHVHTCA